MLAFFDSGYGGLSIFSEVQKLLPQYDYIYLGDNARAPYGERSPETILEFSTQAVDFLFKQGATLIIIACNTATAAALRELQEKYIRAEKSSSKNILGVVMPLVEEAVETSKSGVIAVIGTRATIQSKSYDTEIKKLNPKLKIISQSCPLLVPLIEEGFINRPETMMILKKYVKHLKDYRIDTLIPACTHYTFLIPHLKKIFGKKVQILHSGKIVARKLEEYLERHPEIEKNLSKKGQTRIFTSEYPGRFHETAQLFLGRPLKNIQHVKLAP